MINTIKKIIKYLIFIILGGTLLVVLVFFYLMFKLQHAYYQDLEKRILEQKFDQKLWEFDRGDVRLDMYDDLVKNHLHIGMPWDKVTELLGKELRYETYNSAHRLCFKYYAGSIIYFGAKTFYLLICPDKSNKVIESIELIED